MAYTAERLQLVKKLFIHSHKVTPNSNNIDHCKYSLRRRTINPTKCLFSTWIDDDADDTYDPKQENSPSKRKRSRADDPDTTRSAKRAKGSGSRVVTMVMNSPAGKEFLSSLPMYQDDGSDQENEEWNTAIELSKALAQPAQVSESTDQDAAPPPGPVTSNDLLSTSPKDSDGHPCEMCWTLGLDCILAKDPYAYPCSFCVDNGMDCQQWETPEWKRGCENCKRAKKPCSYESDDKGHELPCQRCRRVGDYCVAGPAREKPKPKHKPAATNNQEIPSNSAPPPSKSAPLPSSAVPVNKTPDTRVIRTSLAHPVDFTYVPPEDGSSPCHWCNNFAYGIVGLGPTEVEVLDSGNGRYIELNGGHVARGHNPSRMCVTCALERVYIMGCPGHRIVALKNYQAETFDHAAAFASLTPGQKMINPWCSLCIEPAFYGCRAIQNVNLYQEPVEPSSPEAVGCGLLLCEKCNMLMRVLGDLGKVIAKNEQRDPDWSRADVCYLVPGNDLYRCYMDAPATN